MDFVHLHLHTTYSFLDGYNPIPKAVARAKELGMTAMAITDHNHLGGVVDFQKECNKQGIKPILGYEGYFTWNMTKTARPIDERTSEAVEAATKDGLLEEGVKYKKSEIKDIIAPYMWDVHQYHIILLAQNQTGWQNLVKIQSESADRCTYNGRFMCDDELLARYSEGVICTSACIGSAPAKLVERGDYEGAEKQILKWAEIFGERFYLEIQPLDIPQQHDVNLFYMEMSKKHGIKVVATNDVHWTNYEDYDDHDTLLCIGTGTYKNQTDRMHYSNDFWLKSAEEMIESFEKQSFSINDLGDENDYEEFYMEALHNTSLIAKTVEPVRLGSPVPLFSNVKVPYGFTPEKYLTLKAFSGMYKYLKEHPECDRFTYELRLNEELSVINGKGFAPYMLAVEEYVTWANDNNCPTGPGRGSAAGSLVLFSIGVTKNIDPIKYGLWFSRFLTKDRVAPPDVDTDFEYNHRDDVITHLEEYYGIEKVAHIGTYTVMGVKSGIKDVGRVLSVDYKEVDAINKKIDEIMDKPQPKFKDFDKLKSGDDNEKKNWEEFDKLEKAHPEIFRLARAFEGTPRNMGIHASGVLVTPIAVTDVVPTRRAKDGTTITLYTGPQLEEYNFIKYDILGLKTLSVIQETLRFVNEDLTFNDLYDEAGLDDSHVYTLISQKATDGVFQIESNMMKGMIEQIKPTELNDIIAINALGRPGPLSAGMPKEYAERKNGMAEVEYPIHGVEDILEETYGVIAYQEQLMAISKRIAGFDDSQADSLTRKVTGKKKVEMMEMLRRCHFYGKKNCKGPEGWEADSKAPWYDEDEHYGQEIPGAVNLGYSEGELNRYWNYILGFCSYAFNKSHAACYSYISFLTAWLKKYYPTEFMAALLSMADDEHRKNYVTVAEGMGIRISTPDINLSGESFTPSGETILYGLGAIKGVGATSIPEIIANRPYESLKDAVGRIPKKSFNKRVGVGLIKAGAFDFEEPNRHIMLNSFYAARKDKDERMDEKEWDRDACIMFEQATLGSAITFKPWWDEVEPNKKICFNAQEVIVHERVDRKGNMMAFIDIIADKCSIHGLIFASKYCKYAGILDCISANTTIMLEGKKDDKGTFIINKASVVAKEKEDEYEDLLESSCEESDNKVA